MLRSGSAPFPFRSGDDTPFCGIPGLVLRRGLVTSSPALGSIISDTGSRRSFTGGTVKFGGAKEDSLLSAGDARAPLE